MGEFLDKLFQNPDDSQFLDAYCPGASQLMHYAAAFYIRKNICAPLWECILHVLTGQEKGRSPHVLLLGNPGVGKSAYFLFILWQLMHDADVPFKTVVYQNFGKLGMTFVFDVVKRTGYRVSCVIDDIVTGKEVLYVCDCGGTANAPSAIVDKPTLVISSPDDKHYHEWVKNIHPLRLYMPTWELVDILKAAACSRVWHAGLPESEQKNNVCPPDDATITGNFQLVGGCYRYAVSVEDPDGIINGAILKMDSTSFKKILESSYLSVATKESNKLFHMIVQKKGDEFDFTKFSTRFASEIVAHRVADRYLGDTVNNAITAIIGLPQTTETAVLRGDLFENVLRRVFGSTHQECRIKCLTAPDCQSFLDADTFPIRLDDNGALLVTLPELRTKPFESLSDIIPTVDNTVWFPRSPNMRAVDAVFAGKTCFQMTSSSLRNRLSHEIDAIGMKNMEELLSELHGVQPSDLVIDLVFVVPNCEGGQHRIDASVPQALKNESKYDLKSMSFEGLVGAMNNSQRWEACKLLYPAEGWTTSEPCASFKQRFPDGTLMKKLTFALEEANKNQPTARKVCEELVKQGPKADLNIKCKIRQWVLHYPLV